MNQAPKVFISYSHDSEEHRRNVLAFANRLRRDGVDAMLDQYVSSPEEGWPRWMNRQLEQADFVVLICTETYMRRVEGREEPGRGHGVMWESNLVYQYLYNAGAVNRKFIPVLLGGGKTEHVPMPLQGVTLFDAATAAGYEELYRHLTMQPRTEQPLLGKLKSLPAIEPPSAPVRHPIAFPHAAKLGVAGALLLMAFAFWFWRTSYAAPEVYRVRVIVLDPDKRSVNDARVTSSLGGEAMKVEGGWQFAFPRPKSPNLRVYAEVPSAFLRGEAELRLGADRSPALTLQLAKNASATVRGIVTTDRGQALPGAKVSVVGYGNEAVTTSADGGFVLAAHAADGQQVQLHAEKAGYHPLTQWHPAGEFAVTLNLDRNR